MDESDFSSDEENCESKKVEQVEQAEVEQAEQTKSHVSEVVDEYLTNHAVLIAVSTKELPILERQKELFLGMHRQIELQNSYVLDQKSMFSVYEMLEEDDDDQDQDQIGAIETKLGEFDLDRYISLQYNVHRALKYLYTHTTATDEFIFGEEEMKKILTIEDQLLVYLILAKAKTS